MKGMKYKMMVASTRNWYAPRVVSLIVRDSANQPDQRDNTRRVPISRGCHHHFVLHSLHLHVCGGDQVVSAAGPARKQRRRAHPWRESRRMDRLGNGLGGRADWHTGFAGPTGRFVGQAGIRIETGWWNSCGNSLGTDVVLARSTTEERRTVRSLKAFFHEARDR